MKNAPGTSVAHAGVDFWRFYLYGDIDGMIISDIAMLETAIGLRFDITEQWDVAVSYAYLKRTLEVEEFYNDVVYDSLNVAVGHSF